MRLTFYNIIIKIFKINVSFYFMIQIKFKIDHNHYFFFIVSTCCLNWSLKKDWFLCTRPTTNIGVNQNQAVLAKRRKDKKYLSQKVKKKLNSACKIEKMIRITKKIIIKISQKKVEKLLG